MQPFKIHAASHCNGVSRQNAAQTGTWSQCLNSLDLHRILLLTGPLSDSENSTFPVNEYLFYKFSNQLEKIQQIFFPRD